MSELSRLNRRAGTPVRVSRLLFGLATDALTAARATDGLFDPTVQRALLAAGYSTTFARIGEGSDANTPPGTKPGRYREVILDAARQTVMLPAGVGLDLGGIAKGWLADAVVRRLGRFGAAAVDLGGDCAFTAPGAHVLPWLIEIADPWADGQPLAELTLDRGGGVATSGIVRRRWWTSQGWRHHLIDPRNGQPAATDLASVTVLAPSAAAAEVMAKVVLLLGREQGTRALDRRAAFAGLLVPLVGPPIHVRAAFGQ
jgi:thiamine biosynthesis lipoprotein